MYLSLLIPAFNEASRIKPGLKKALEFLKNKDFSWEVIVVDDGSEDQTVRQVRGLMKNTPQLRLISLGKNFGKGHAIRVGITAASGNLIVFSDADFSVPIKTLPAFLARLKNKDLVYGSRRTRGSQVVKHQNLFREALGHAFTQLTNFVLGLCVSDATCGFKGFKKKSGKKLFSLQQLNRWGFDAEILFLARKYQVKTFELPVMWKDVEGTKVSLFSDTFRSLFDLVKIRIYDLFGAY